MRGVLQPPSRNETVDSLATIFVTVPSVNRSYMIDANMHQTR